MTGSLADVRRRRSSSNTDKYEKHILADDCDPPTILKHDESGEHQYALMAGGAQGRRSAVSPVTKSGGFATLRWDSSTGADAYVVVRDGKDITGPLRLEGAQKQWADNGAP